MLTRDYLMRMIDTLVKVLAKLIFLKKSKNYPEALKELDSLTKNLLGIDRKFISSLSDDQLLKIIDPDEKLIPAKCYLLGVVMKEEAEIYELQGLEDNSFKLYMRSFNMFLLGIQNSPKIIEEEHLDKINTVIKKIDMYEIPENIKEKLFFYFEFSDKYDKAEDMLFELIENNPGFIEKGIQFYERLLKKSDEELEKGNLPRIEVEESLANIKEKL